MIPILRVVRFFLAVLSSMDAGPEKLHYLLHHWGLQSGCVEGERAQSIQGICKRVIIRKALEQELLKGGSEFLRGLVDSDEAVRIKDCSSL